MHHLLPFFVFTYLTLIRTVTSRHVFAAPPTLKGRNPITFSTNITHNSTISLGSQSSDSSRNQTISTTKDSHADNRTGTVTAAPSGPSTSDIDRICVLGDPACTQKGITKTQDGPSVSLNLEDECLLWDTSCKGNKTKALEDFFGETQGDLEEFACFVHQWPNCSSYESPQRLSQFRNVLTWMRSPSCYSSQAEYGSMIGEPLPSAAPGESCCGLCFIDAEDVDVYYWPEPDTDTSCLSIIGESVNPFGYGATTDSAGVYWACTAQNPISGQSIITTATVTVIDSITVKESLVNPWSPPPCIGDISPSSAASSSFKQPVASRGSIASIRARGHSLIVAQNITQNSGEAIATVVSGGHTFTSPSIYANFHNLRANDECGPRGSAQGPISTTMLAFSPGELSTIAGPLWTPHGSNAGSGTASSKTFNFGDLPCPPHSVMEENWYKPEPGEPYRPLIALPQKILDIDPWFGNCTGLFFTGFDPPKTLTPATAMVAITTTNDPDPSTTMPMPSPTVDPGPKETNTMSGLAPVPVPTSAAAQPQPLLQPQKTTDLPPVPQQTGSSSELDAPSGNRGDPGQPSTTASNPNQQIVDTAPQAGPSSVARDPETDSTPLPVNDPGQGVNPANDGGKPAQTGNSNLEQQATSVDNDPSQGASTPSFQDPVLPSETSIPFGDQTIVVGTSGPAISGSPIGPNEPPVTASGAAVINQGGSMVIANQILSLASAAPLATTIAGHVIQSSTNGIYFDGSVITPGASPITIAGAAVSIGPSSQIYVGGQSYKLPTPIPNAATTLTNGAVASPVSNGVSIYGTTLAAGAPPVVISGTSISLDASNNIYWNPTAHVLPSLTPFTPVASQNQAINGQTFQAVANGISIAGTILTPGAPRITISGTPIALGPSALLVGSSTIPFKIPGAAPLITAVGDQSITAYPSGVEIAGSTLTPGASGMTVSGTLVSLNTAGNLILGSQTIPLSITSSGSELPFITAVKGQTITAKPTAINVGDSTISPGAPGITIDGTLISLNTAGDLILGSKTISLTTPNDASGTPFITAINGQTITANPTGINIGGSTMSPGAPGITIDGTIVSLGTAGELVVGSKTIPLASTSSGLGGLIMGGFGPGGASSSGLASQGGLATGVANGTGGPAAVGFEGVGVRIRGRGLWVVTGVLVAIGGKWILE